MCEEMSQQGASVEQLILQLSELDAVKLGSFKLKSGILSPIYFDLRVLVSHPKVLRNASEAIWDILKNLQYDNICGVPYTALPIASCITTVHDVPMLLKRKEAKEYGTKKILEGTFRRGDRCVIIEDVVTSGGSVLETAACLKAEGLEVTDVIVLLDRKQGGQESLSHHGITLHSVFNVDVILDVLKANNKISEEQVTSVREFVSTHQMTASMTSVIDPIEDIVLRLHDIGSFRFGSFKLSNGMITPIYVDLRLVISHPVLMSDICKQMYLLVKDEVKFDILCGVPYAALHLATCMAKDQNLQNVLLRKTVKAYGTGKLIEGVYEKGQRCLVVEDVMVSGQGIYEAVESVKTQGLEASDALLVLDRQQCGEQNLDNQGIKLHCLIRISDALDTLVKHKRIDSNIAEKVMDFLRSNPANIPLTKQETKERTSKINELLPFDERGKLCKNTVAARLFNIMNSKKSNLCVAADMCTFSQLLEVAEKVGPHICMLKTHVDILNDFSIENIEKLKIIAHEHNFIIFEDRKFADIGTTVKKQYGEGIYRIADWADLCNAHSLPGPGIISGLAEVGISKQRACVLLAEMSSKGNLANASYSVATVNMARENSDFVIGFISQSKLTSDPTLIHMTPGVKLSEGGDDLGQLYTSPIDAVTLRGADIIIVGRGITASNDMKTAAQEYQEAGYGAYESVRAQQVSER